MAARCCEVVQGWEEEVMGVGGMLHDPRHKRGCGVWPLSWAYIGPRKVKLGFPSSPLPG